MCYHIPRLQISPEQSCYKALNINPEWETGSRCGVLLLMTGYADVPQKSRQDQLISSGTTATSSATTPTADTQGPKELFVLTRTFPPP